MPTQSEEWFDRYVRDHGHDPGDPEPELGIGKRPDRLITWNGFAVACEVKEFATSPAERRRDDAGGQVFAMSSREVLAPIREAIKSASEQLKPLNVAGYPLVAVLANPRGVPLDLGADDVIHALYGDPQWTFTLDLETGGPAGPVEFGAGAGGQVRRLRRDGDELRHQYLSAVVVLRRRTHEHDWRDGLAAELAERRGWTPKTYEEASVAAEEYMAACNQARDRGEIPDGDYIHADVIATMSDTAVALPDDVFDGSRDHRWRFEPAAHGYMQVR